MIEEKEKKRKEQENEEKKYPRNAIESFQQHSCAAFMCKIVVNESFIWTGSKAFKSEQDLWKQ